MAEDLKPHAMRATLNVPRELLESSVLTLQQLLEAANAPYVPDGAPEESELPPELVGLEQPGHLQPVRDLLDRVATRGWTAATMEDVQRARECLRNVEQNGMARPVPAFFGKPPQ